MRAARTLGIKGDEGHVVEVAGARRRVARCVAAVLLVAALLGTSQKAWAGGYPPDPHTPPPQPPAECQSSAVTAKPGDHLFASITNVPVGTLVTLTFDGTPVGSARTTADGSGEDSSAPAPSQPASGLGGAIVHFTVPADAVAGTHILEFTGVGVSCDAALDFVLGESITPRPLARTGTNAALYVAIALVLLVVGIQLVLLARRRRRRSAAERHPIRRYHLHNFH